MGAKEFLQGKWLGHPLHPALVHVPAGLWPVALVLDLLSLGGFGGAAFVQVSFTAILVGLIVAIVAVPPGWVDWTGIKREKPAWKLGLFHMILNGLAMLVWLANLVIRIPGLRETEQVTGGQVGLSAIGTVLLFAGAWFGGRMVFDKGTSIARTSKKSLRRAAEKGGANLPDK